MKLRDPFTGETVDVEPHAKVDTHSRMTLDEFAELSGGRRRLVRQARFVLHDEPGPRPTEITITCEPDDLEASLASMSTALQALGWHGRIEVTSKEVPA